MSTAVDKARKDQEEVLKKKESAERIYYSASEKDIPNLIDIVEDNQGRIGWLLSDGKIVYETTIEKKKYRPPTRGSLPNELYLGNYEKILALGTEHTGGTGGMDGKTGGIKSNGEAKPEVPEVPEVCRGCQQLFDDLIGYHKTVSQLPKEEDYILLTAWDFHTYCLDRAEYSPIIYFFSTAEKGKSRTIKGMTYVAYRGIRKGDIKDAQLLRDCTHLRASIAFDMTDFWLKTKQSGSEDVVLNRYERGVTVTRINRPEKGAFQDTDFYDVFGPTVLATNEIINDIADSRALCITMRRATQDFEQAVTQKLGLPFKERLIAFKLVHGSDEWEQPEKVVRGRLGDITRPLLQIIYNVAPQYIDKFVLLVKDFEKAKLTEKANSIQGEIVRCIVASESWVEQGLLTNQSILNKYNKEKEEKEKITPRRMSSYLKSLGFQMTRTTQNLSAVWWDDDLIDRLSQEFDVAENKKGPLLSTSGTSEPPVPPEKVEPFPNIWGESGQND